MKPETVYRQKETWILPNGRYGAFEINIETDAFILTEGATTLFIKTSQGSPRKPSFLEFQRKLSGSNKSNKKGAPVATQTEGKMTGLKYVVNEQLDGWKAERLKILSKQIP
ncbi:hypothetical protein RCOM_0474370 [Ricinus communis]|uniref:Uncharacterized protein n=1 Tax=Ricinus communis TaxID=3988 RepID=B9SCJ2_RICCO|nr:hypothetical protein RCOM_0474370 [Ricinus communis]